MNPGEWARVCEVFHRVCEAAPSERPQLVADLCADDPTLRREVEAMLAADGPSSGFLERPLDWPAPAAEAVPSLPARIGNYRILGLIGSGGMGTVYRAVRDDFPKTVALKVVRATVDSVETRRRFERERQILAGLEHPGIARLYDGGNDERGPYLVMEHVGGLPLLEHAVGHRLSLAQRLRLFLAVCEAVAYAHAQGVLHRDLKPSNVLVSAGGEPKLLDFGVARLLAPAGSERTLTVPLMTPEYASPEQVRGERLTPASDVYSLAVMLFELLTGVRPYPLTSRALRDVERVICEVDPPPPSVVASRGAATTSGAGETASPTPPTSDGRALGRQLRGDLDAVLLKALRKDPASRYPTVAALASDLQRHLDGQPVLARRGTWRYRAGKALRRQRAAAIAALTAILALGVGFGMSRLSAPRPWVSTSGSAQRPSLLVLPLADLRSPAGASGVPPALGQMLRSQLAVGERLRVVGGEMSRRMADAAAASTPDGGELRRLHQQLRVDLVLAGTVGPGSRQGSALTVGGTLYDTATGRAVAHLAERGDASHLLELAARVSGQVRAALGLPAPSSRETAASLATWPADREAARAYAEGLAALDDLDALHARELLSRAAALAPLHPLVHLALARAWAALGYDPRSVAEAARAQALAADLPRVEQVLVEAYYHETRHEAPAAIRLYGSLFTLYPDDLEYGLALARVQADTVPGDALVTLAQLRQRASPGGEDPRIDLTEGQVGFRLADHARTLAAAKRAAGKGARQGLPWIVVDARLLEARARTWQNDWAGADAAASEALAVAQRAGYRRAVAEALKRLARNDWQRGWLPQAEAHARQALAAFGELGNEDGVGMLTMILASVRCELGDWRGSLPLFDRALASSRLTGSYDTGHRHCSTMGGRGWSSASWRPRRSDSRPMPARWPGGASPPIASSGRCGWQRWPWSAPSRRRPARSSPPPWPPPASSATRSCAPGPRCASLMSPRAAVTCAAPATRSRSSCRSSRA